MHIKVDKSNTIKTPSIKYKGNINTEYRILFTGDISYAENYLAEYAFRPDFGYNLLERYGYDYPFEKISSMLYNSDMVISNLETPLIDRAITPIPSFTFSSDNRYNSKLGRFQAWSDVHTVPSFLRKYNVLNLSLANNHMLDQGEYGLKQTLRSLKENGIRYFGAGRNAKQALRPFLENIVIGDKKLKVFVFSGFEYRKGYDEDFGFYAKKNKYGVNRLSVNKIKAEINRIREKYTDVYIVIFPHWGGARNYGWKTDHQTRLAHKFIDAGADIVIGHGPHNLQQIEKYRGHWILYSIGNFMYNSLGNYDKWNAMPFSLVVSLCLSPKKKRSNYPAQIEKHLKIYPINTDNNMTNFQPRPVSKEEFDIIYKSLISYNKNIQWKPDKDELRVGLDKIGLYIKLSL